MGFFSTAAEFTHKYALPPTTTLTVAIKVLQDHDWVLKLDPELVSYTPSSPCPSPQTKTYIATNNMPSIPSYIHDPIVKVSIEITDVERGIDLDVRPPLGIVQKGRWRVEGEQGGELMLVVWTEVECNRVLMGIMKGKVEGQKKRVGERYFEALKGC